MFILLMVANMTVASHSRLLRSPVRLAQFTASLREHPFGLVCLGSFLFCSAMFLPFNFISVQAETFGISDASYRSCLELHEECLLNQNVSYSR